MASVKAKRKMSQKGEDVVTLRIPFDRLEAVRKSVADAFMDAEGGSKKEDDLVTVLTTMNQILLGGNMKSKVKFKSVFTTAD